jgi:hypothetical protein
VGHVEPRARRCRLGFGDHVHVGLDPHIDVVKKG